MLTLAVSPASGTLGRQLPESLQLPSLRPIQSDARAVPPPTTSAVTIAAAQAIKRRIRPARDMKPTSGVATYGPSPYLQWNSDFRGYCAVLAAFATELTIFFAASVR